MAMISEDFKQNKSHMDHFYHTFMVILTLFKAYKPHYTFLAFASKIVFKIFPFSFYM